MKNYFNTLPKLFGLRKYSRPSNPLDHQEIPLLNHQQLVDYYRRWGHYHANIDPLNLIKRKPPVLQINSDPIPNGINIGGHLYYNCQNLEEKLTSIYCKNIGFETNQLATEEEQLWMTQTIEAMSSVQASSSTKSRIGKLLLESETFDHFMAKKFGQVKRYGLEGCESMIVALDILFQVASGDHAIITMPHRGRLNLMVGLLNYPAEAIFNKLRGNSELPAHIPGTGDVLSHLYHQGSLKIGGQDGLATLLPNPSHLEAINPVGAGCAYAMAEYMGKRVIPIQIHGDGAFAAQGIVMETLQLARLRGFNVGGTIHLLVNNQLSFTASAEIARSTEYATDPAKMIGCPIIHVNADSPEDVSRAMVIAVKYREKFRKDVMVDLIGYRRHGHNELDEPSFTQPLMYKAIRGEETIPTKYTQKLKAEKIWNNEEGRSIVQNFDRQLEAALNNCTVFQPTEFGLQRQMNFSWRSAKKMPETGVSVQILKEVGEQSVNVNGIDNVHPRLLKFHIEARLKALQEGSGIDWATAESLAVGSLLAEGNSVRWVGQDVSRGTFSHRHWEFKDQDTNASIIPLANLATKGARLEIYNSCLSELGVLGFEYGLSITKADDTLSIWEAQFGDFFNGAQVILDTFVSSGAPKWGLQSGLVMLLPHGYDGTGPEHSSCRIERFLQMANDKIPTLPSGNEHQRDARHHESDQHDNHQSLVNWQIVNPSTPANYFHLLRRQMLRSYRQPLIVAAPKTLLRLPAAVSQLSDMDKGTCFLSIIEDDTIGTSKSNIKKVETVLFVSGKAYYELAKERNTRRLDGKLAIIRIEELCPFPYAQLTQVVKKYNHASQFIWFQEEPRNMGAYDYVNPRLQSILDQKATGTKTITYVGRDCSAAPATGISSVHKLECSQLYEQLFGLVQ